VGFHGRLTSADLPAGVLSRYRHRGDCRLSSHCSCAVTAAEEIVEETDLDEETAMTTITEPDISAAEMTAAAEPVAAAPSTVSIYAAIGGRAAVTAAVDGLYSRLLADPELGHFFPGRVGPAHRAFVVTLVGQALGGPERYRGPDLAGAHRGLGITDAHFDRTAAHLDATLDELGVPRELTDQIVGIVATLRPAVVGT